MSQMLNILKTKKFHRIVNNILESATPELLFGSRPNLA